MRAIRVPLILIAAALLAALCLAQVATSRLEGTVQDESGALVPNATVAVVNAKTQVRAETKSGAQGQYIFVALQPGRVHA